MQILHMCPAGIATGGTEGIHNLVHHLNLCGADAKILYVGDDLSNPQPKEYEKYECEYLTEYPLNFQGCLILPEIWANQVLNPSYVNCRVAVNWQGVDVYYWHNPKNQHKFLRRKSVVHIANSEYAMSHLRGLGLQPIKISDCLNDEFFEPYEEESRSNIVLYNPTDSKMTDFQRRVMRDCVGVTFKPIQGYSRSELIELMRHSKLYIDFGVFSGRERLPREAVMCGCCILTSNKGTAGNFLDNGILDTYKPTSELEAIKRIRYILSNFDTCMAEFDGYRQALKQDKDNYLSEVRKLYYAILNNHPGT